MKRRSSVVGCLSAMLLAGSIASARAAAAGERPPNIIFILLDDQGWADGSSLGHPYMKTPNIDRLVREGTRFGQFYVSNPVCSPSRTAFMTGQFPARHRVHQHFATHEQNAQRGMPDWLDPDATTYPVCTPARASLVTSRMPHEMGILSNRICPGIPNNIPDSRRSVQTGPLGMCNAVEGQEHGLPARAGTMGRRHQLAAPSGQSGCQSRSYRRNRHGNAGRWPTDGCD